MNTTNQQQPLNRKQQYIVIIKVILAMTIFLVGIPFLMFLATSYYSNKGLMMDSYLISQEYTDKVSSFYEKNNHCPSNLDISTHLTNNDTVSRIDFISNTETKNCYIVSTLKEMGTSLDGKTIILSKSFNTITTDWQCFSNANNLYLPKDCKNTLPEQLINHIR